MKKQKLTVYTSKKCPRCKALKKWLRKNKLSFVTKSLDDTEIMASLIMRNIFVLSAPAIEIPRCSALQRDSSFVKIGNRVFLSDQIFQENNSLQPSFIKIMERK